MPASVPFPSENDGGRQIREIAGSGQLRRDELADFLRTRRAALKPEDVGLPSGGRRRTPGLRREEVAQLAGMGATWYTWLEQGRGGAPSADVLDRIARALMLTDVEREHLFLLGLGRPPEARYQKIEGVTPRLQRVLDALDPSPALIRTAIWDVLAWNQAATLMLMDYGSLPPERRNILRFIFLDPRARAAQYDWESVARFVLGAFRVDAARAGAVAEVEPLVEELCRLSPDFKAMWRDNDVRGPHGEAVKRIRHPILGALSFEYSAFAVDGRTDLTMVVYNPATPKDAEKIRSSMAPR
jgi:transcriptional regulator with XRE-family HTH domain